jgi:hypothetical protein
MPIKTIIIAQRKWEKWIASPFLAINTSLAFFPFYGKENITTNVSYRDLLVKPGVPLN